MLSETDLRLCFSALEACAATRGGVRVRPPAADGGEALLCRPPQGPSIYDVHKMFVLFMPLPSIFTS